MPALAVLAKRIACHSQLLNCNWDNLDVSFKERPIQLFSRSFAQPTLYYHVRFQD